MALHRVWEPREVDPSGGALGAYEALRDVQYSLINQSIYGRNSELLCLSKSIAKLDSIANLGSVSQK